MIIRVRNLRLRVIVGVNDWEQLSPREVVANIEMEFDGTKAAESDNVADTPDYSAICRRIIEKIEPQRFALLEKLASQILRIVLEDRRIRRATVELDKPGALHFADSVAVVCEGENSPTPRRQGKTTRRG
jgi:FolB domain-containing protein